MKTRTIKLDEAVRALFPNLPWKWTGQTEEYNGAIFSANDPTTVAVYGDEVYNNDPEWIMKMQYIAHACNVLPEVVDALKMALVQVAQDNDERNAEHRGTEMQIIAALAKAEYIQVEVEDEKS
jgi:hypothetical protein